MYFQQITHIIMCLRIFKKTLDKVFQVAIFLDSCITFRFFYSICFVIEYIELLVDLFIIFYGIAWKSALSQNRISP